MPSRQTRTASVERGARRGGAQRPRPAAHPAARPAGRTSRSACCTRDGEPVPPPLAPDAGARRRRSRPSSSGSLLAARRRPSRRTTPPRARPARRRAATGWAGRSTSAPSRSKPLDGRRDGVRAEQAAPAVVRRWWALNAAATRRRADRPGSSSTRPTTDRVSSTGQPAPAQAATSRSSSVAGQHVEQRRGGDQGRAGEVARVQPGDVVLSRLDGDRGAVGGRAGEVGGGDARAGRRRGRAATQCCGPGSSGASQRPIAPLPQPRSWITARPVGREVAQEALDEVGGAGRGVGGLAQREPLRLTRTSSRRSSRRPGQDACERRTWWPTSASSDSRRSRAARRSRSRSSASPSQARSAAASAAGSPGGTSSPGRLAVRRRDRAPPAPRRRRSRRPARRGPAPRSRPCRRSRRARPAPAGPRRRSCARDRRRCAVPGSARGRPARRPASGAGDRSTNAGSRSRLPTQTQLPGQVRRRRERVEQHVVALVGGHRRDAQQRPAARASRAPARRRRHRARRRARARPAARTARAAGAASRRWS